MYATPSNDMDYLTAVSRGGEGYIVSRDRYSVLRNLQSEKGLDVVLLKFCDCSSIKSDSVRSVKIGGKLVSLQAIEYRIIGTTVTSSSYVSNENGQQAFRSTYRNWGSHHK